MSKVPVRTRVAAAAAAPVLLLAACAKPLEVTIPDTLVARRPGQRRIQRVHDTGQAE